MGSRFSIFMHIHAYFKSLVSHITLQNCPHQGACTTLPPHANLVALPRAPHASGMRGPLPLPQPSYRHPGTR